MQGISEIDGTETVWHKLCIFASQIYINGLAWDYFNFSELAMELP